MVMKHIITYDVLACDTLEPRVVIILVVRVLCVLHMNHMAGLGFRHDAQPVPRSLHQVRHHVWMDHPVWSALVRPSWEFQDND
eukprot:2840082-Amphidinium_carterae.1